MAKAVTTSNTYKVPFEGPRHGTPRSLELKFLPRLPSPRLQNASETATTDAIGR